MKPKLKKRKPKLSARRINKDSLPQICTFKPKDLKNYINGLQEYLDNETIIIQEGISLDERESIFNEIRFWENILSVLKQLNLL